MALVWQTALRALEYLAPSELFQAVHRVEAQIAGTVFALGQGLGRRQTFLHLDALSEVQGVENFSFFLTFVHLAG